MCIPGYTLAQWSNEMKRLVRPVPNWTENLDQLDAFCCIIHTSNDIYIAVPDIIPAAAPPPLLFLLLLLLFYYYYYYYYYRGYFNTLVFLFVNK